MDLENPYPRGFWRFRPPRCPHAACPTRQVRNGPFPWQRKGRYQRRCDRRFVQRFLCLTCRRTFSVQTFRVDYRLHRTDLTPRLFDTFVSAVTQRQAARIMECDRKTVRRRMILLSDYARDFHTAILERERRRGGLSGHFQLDELETYEHSRRLAPLTMPVLIELHSYFAVHFEVATLPARGRLKPRDLQRKDQRELLHGVRKSGSREAVKACFTRLAHIVPSDRRTPISTDQKSSYPTVLREVMRSPFEHARHSSKAPRTPLNPLFPINHTLAMLRSGMSRLVQRTWAQTKERAWLVRHAWIWLAYRNYIRDITNESRWISSAQVLGVTARQFTKRNFFEWRLELVP